MQEQRPYKLTPEQGWSQMTVILEEAMPVVRRSRRPLIYWWAAAAITSFAIISLIALLDINTTPGGQYSANQSKEFQQPADQGTTSDATISNNTTTTEAIEDGSNTSSSKSESPTTFAGAVSNKKESTAQVNSNSTAHKNYVAINPSVNVIGVKKEVIANSDITDQLETIDATRLLHVDPLSDLSTTCGVFKDGIAFLPMLAFDELEVGLNSEISVEPVIKRSSKFRPHLTAGILRSFSNGLGVNFGGGINLRLGGKVSLTGDVAYQYYDTDVSLALGGKQDSENSINPIIKTDLGYLGYGDYLPAEVVNNSSNQVITPFVKNLHQWQLSGGVRYDVSRKFFADAGATLNFGIVAHSSHPIISMDTNDPLSGDFFNISNSFNSLDIVKSTTTSVYGGIGYKLSPKTELFAQVVHGLDHYLVNPQSLPSAEATKRTDHIRGINVGLRHHLTAGP